MTKKSILTMMSLSMSQTWSAEIIGNHQHMVMASCFNTLWGDISYDVWRAEWKHIDRSSSKCILRGRVDKIDSWVLAEDECFYVSPSADSCTGANEA